MNFNSSGKAFVKLSMNHRHVTVVEVKCIQVYEYFMELDRIQLKFRLLNRTKLNTRSHHTLVSVHAGLGGSGSSN